MFIDATKVVFSQNATNFLIYCFHIFKSSLVSMFIKLLYLQDKKYVVYCLDCARRHNHELRGFVILEEYHLKELKDVYNNFKLSSQNPLSNLNSAQRSYQGTHAQATLTPICRPQPTITNNSMITNRYRSF